MSICSPFFRHVVFAIARTVIVANDRRSFVAEPVFELDDEACNFAALAAESDAPTSAATDGGRELSIVTAVGHLLLAVEREGGEQRF